MALLGARKALRCLGVGGAALLLSVAVLTGAPTAHAGETAPLREVTLAFTGDVLAHRALNTRAWLYGGRKAFDFGPMFDDIRPTLEDADLAVCQLEGPVAPPGVRFQGSPIFAVPPTMVSALKGAGYDYCTTANNHANDRGPAGVATTIRTFDAVGLGHAGTGRSVDEAQAPVIDVNGVKVALLSHTAYFSGQKRFFLRSTMWINLLSAARVIAEAKLARERGAEVVIASLHWGTEFRRTPTLFQTAVADTLTASGEIDAIVGHHAHVIQPIKQVNGKWVLYGLGNGLSNQRRATVGHAGTQDGVIAQLRIVEQPGGGFVVDRPVIIPTWVHSRTFVIYDVAQHYFDSTLAERYLQALRKSWARTLTVVGDFVAPLPVP